MAGTKIQGVTVPKEATAQNRPDLFGTRGQLTPDGDGGMLSRMMSDRPEYATPKDSQIDGGFYVGDRGLPWHVTLARQLGETELMRDAGRLLTVEEALAAAGSFEVGLAPVQTATGLEIPGKFATIRQDTGAPLGVVGRGYKVFQEKALAELASHIVGIGGSTKPLFETGGHMREGAWFFLSMELRGLDLEVPGDPSPLQTYLLLFTSHDGSKPGGYYVTQVRTVCKNTADLARAGALSTFRIRHTGSLDGKVAEARRALGIAVRSTERVEEVVNRLAMTRIVDSQIEDILKKAWPIRISKDGDEEIEHKSRKMELIRRNYEESETLDGIRGTGWGLYNAGTEALDHLVAYHGRKRQSDDDARADSLLFGSAHDDKERLLKAVLAVGAK